MKVLAADGYMLCRALVRSLILLRGDVSVIAADNIDEVLARIADHQTSILSCLIR